MKYLIVSFVLGVVIANLFPSLVRMSLPDLGLLFSIIGGWAFLLAPKIRRA